MFVNNNETINLEYKKHHFVTQEDKGSATSEQHTGVGAQVPHSYYFTTRILVLKFANKGVFFEEIQDSHFHRKRGYFGIHLCKFGEKGVIFQCFSVKRGLIWAEKSVLYYKKGGSFWSEKSVFYREKEVVLSWKVKWFAAKKGVIFKMETKDGYHFFQWVRELGVGVVIHSLKVEIVLLPLCLFIDYDIINNIPARTLQFASN